MPAMATKRHGTHPNMRATPGEIEYAMENLQLDLPKRNRLKLMDFLGHLPVGVAWASIPDGKIRYVNERFVSLFGYELAELSTVHDWILRCYARPEQAAAIDNFWYRQATGSEKLE